MQDYNSLRIMYNQSVHDGQAMFNYYHTLRTAIVGDITFISHPNSGSAFSTLALGTLLVFLAMGASFYLSPLVEYGARRPLCKRDQ